MDTHILDVLDEIVSALASACHVFEDVKQVRTDWRCLSFGLLRASKRIAVNQRGSRRQGQSRIAVA